MICPFVSHIAGGRPQRQRDQSVLHGRIDCLGGQRAVGRLAVAQRTLGHGGGGAPVNVGWGDAARVRLGAVGGNSRVAPSRWKASSNGAHSCRMRR